MAMYLTRFRQTGDTWARLVQNPEDRRDTLRPIIEAVGGRLHGYWYAFGEDDGYVLLEAPDDKTIARVLTRVAASGAFTGVATTKLLTVEEMLDALRGGDIAYRPPGA